jgi:5-methylthioribose kinase
MRYFTLFKKKKKLAKIFTKTEKISKMTIFKNQYFLNNKNRHSAVLRKEASSTSLPSLKNIKIMFF